MYGRKLKNQMPRDRFLIDLIEFVDNSFAVNLEN